MLTNVIKQMLLPRESFRAKITTMRCLSRVPHNVIRKVFFTSKRFTCKANALIKIVLN